jgi:hypothetical protein
MDFDDRAYLPTLEVIALECSRIRAGWSAVERRARRVGPPDVVHWRPPVFADELVA